LFREGEFPNWRSVKYSNIDLNCMYIYQNVQIPSSMNTVFD